MVTGAWRIRRTAAFRGHLTVDGNHLEHHIDNNCIAEADCIDHARASEHYEISFATAMRMAFKSTWPVKKREGEHAVLGL
jgi:hypothetical protein